MDEIIKAISDDGFVSVSVITSRELTERARNIHASTPVVTAALGRTLAAAAMIGSNLKHPDASLTVRINGGGPVGTIIVVADNEGDVRGFVQNPLANVQNKVAGKLNVGGVVGKDGMLSVIKDFKDKEPYTGSTELVSGEIAEDFTAYFAVSEQIPSVCALGVLIGRDRSVLAAGGYIAQLLPGAPEGLIDALEKNVNETGAVTDILLKGTAETLLDSIMSGFSPHIMERRCVGYKCKCNREKFLAAVMSLDESDLNDILSKGEPIETRCQFCESVYVFDTRELAAWNA